MSEKLTIHLDVNDERQTKCFQWAMSLCEYAHMDHAFLADFWNRLMQDPPVFEEFHYYLENQNYLCETKVSGISVVDILIWQLDRFKTELDQDKSDLKQNGDKILLTAFDTFLKMRQNPDFYINALQTDTGTDYIGKF